MLGPLQATSSVSNAEEAYYRPIGNQAKGPEVHIYNGVEIPDCLPVNKDQGEFQRALITKSSDVSSAEYTNCYMPSTPTWMKNRKVTGGGPGHGKLFVPSITSDERLWESLESASSPKTIRRTCDPPSIIRPPGHFEDEDHAEKSDVERLLGVVARLRTSNRELQERAAEERMARLDLEDSFHVTFTNAKLRCLAKAIGKEDLLPPPSP